MKISIKFPRPLPRVIDATQMRVGQLGQMQGPKYFDIVLCVSGGRLISLTDPQNTWSHLESGITRVCLLDPGTEIVLSQEEF